MPSFEDWRFDWLDCPCFDEEGRLLLRIPDGRDRDPLDRWTHGRITLLGDGAHAMYPIGSNGASQAIVDARILARELRDRGIGTDALEAYEDIRRPATSRIVLANRGNGPDQVMQIVEERCAGVFGDISEVLSRQELEDTAAGYKKLAGSTSRL